MKDLAVDVRLAVSSNSNNGCGRRGTPSSHQRVIGTRRDAVFGPSSRQRLLPAPDRHSGNGVEPVSHHDEQVTGPGRRAHWTAVGLFALLWGLTAVLGETRSALPSQADSLSRSAGSEDS